MRSISLYDRVRRKSFLHQAWRDIRQNAIASKSIETKSEVSEFEIEIDKHLKRIKDQLRERRYHFQPAKGQLLKRPGKKPRPIVVAPIGDRIVQRSILLVLKGIATVKALLEQPRSYGGIPKRGVKDAVREVHEAITKAGRYYIKSDIIEFFARVPHPEALSQLMRVLPDRSLDDLLQEATTTELANMDQLAEHSEEFPIHEIGIAQGCSLSPLLANIVLHDFDRAVNSHDIICLRYIDDFLILGPTDRAVWAAFRKGTRILQNLGLDAYNPKDRSGKAMEGSTERRIEFLGCDISRGFIQPSKKAQARLLEKIRKLTRQSTRFFEKPYKVSSDYEKRSLAATLRMISNIVRAWGNQYSFCNADQVFAALDQDIDELMRKYIGTYATMRERFDKSNQRRMLGVHLLVDSKRDPVLAYRKRTGARDE